MRHVIFAFLLGLLVTSCQQNSKPNQFPNEQSEMALAMRDMTAKLRLAKESIQNGDTSQLSIEDFRDYHFTDSSFHQNGFEPMAEHFLKLVEDFDQDPSFTHYEMVLNSCKSCHQLMCPGPLEMIKTLELD